MATPTSYTITTSDGITSFTITPTTLNSATSLSLVGQNAINYGDDINQNFVRLMENFSNNTPPSNPIRGQLWFKTDETYASGFIHTTLGYDLGKGDFMPRIYITRETSPGGPQGPGYWTILPTAIVDADDPTVKRSDYIATPGNLWLDTDPTDDAIPATNTYYDHSILKVFDPISGGWRSVAANYVLLKGNQTITGNITIDGTLEVTSAVTLNTTLDVVGAVTITSTLDVTDATTLNSSLDVVGPTILNSSLSVVGNATMSGMTTLTAAGIALTVVDSASIGQDLTVTNNLNVGVNTSTDTLMVVTSASITGLVTIDLSDQFATALNITGSGLITGDLSVTGSGTGNITVSNSINVGNSLTVTNNLTVSSGLITCNDVNMTNHNVKNLADPVFPTDGATKNYVDSFYLRRDTGISAVENTMTAILLLDNVNQNSAPNSATTKQWVSDNLDLKVNRAGDTVTGLLTIDVGGSGTGLNVIGDATVGGLLTTNDLAVNDVATFNGDFSVRNTLKVFADRASLESTFVENVSMRTTPLPTDVPNVQYITDAVGNIQNNFAKINPTTPKEGDLRIINSPLLVSIFANNDWRQIYPAVYA